MAFPDRASALPVWLTPAPVPPTKVPLDISTVTTGGTAVTAFSAGHVSGGGWIQNPPTAVTNLGINEAGAGHPAVLVPTDGLTVFILPGSSYQIAPGPGSVSVISTDSAHPFAGMGYQ